MVPYLLASLVYHQSYLLTFQEKHPQHRLFLLREYEPAASSRDFKAGCNRNLVKEMTATIVPPHLVLANQIVDMQKGMDVIRAEIISKLDGQNMLRNFIINGTVPITHL